MARDSKTWFQRIVILQDSNSDTKINLSDQNVAQFGTNRTSEIKAKIGDNGKPFWELYDEYLDTL